MNEKETLFDFPEGQIQGKKKSPWTPLWIRTDGSQDYEVVDNQYEKAKADIKRAFWFIVDSFPDTKEFSSADIVEEIRKLGDEDLLAMTHTNTFPSLINALVRSGKYEHVGWGKNRTDGVRSLGRPIKTYRRRLRRLS